MGEFSLDIIHYLYKNTYTMFRIVVL